MRTIEARKAIAEQLPWVTKLKEPQRCICYRAGAPLRIYFPEGSRIRVTEADYKYWRCKQPAWWRFRSLKKSWPKDGTYCWRHLVERAIYGDDAEYNRAEKWMEKKGIE